jgi:hypothetical protein
MFNGNKYFYQCREDESAMQILQLIMIEAIVKPLSFMAKNLKSYLVDKIILKKEDY